LSTVSPAELAALACAVLWAINGLLLRSQADRVPPGAMNFVRCAVAATLFLLLIPLDPHLHGLLHVPAVELALLAASVVVGIGVGDTLYMIALREIGIARTIALSGVFPLTTMVWEAVLLGHPPSGSLVLGGGLVAVGVVLLSGSSRAPRDAPSSARTSRLPGKDEYPPDSDRRAPGPERTGLGIALSLIAAVFWGLSSVLLKPGIAHLSLIQANAVRMPMVAVFLFLFRILPSGRRSLQAFDRRAFLVVASTGVLGMGMGAFLFLYAIGHITVSKAVTLTATAPVFGLIFGALFMHERLTPRVVAGMACCMGGVWAVL